MGRKCLVFCSLLCCNPRRCNRARSINNGGSLSRYREGARLRNAIPNGRGNGRASPTIGFQKAEGEVYNLGVLTTAESAILFGDDINQNKRLLVGVDRAVDAVVDVASTGENVQN